MKRRLSSIGKTGFITLEVAQREIGERQFPDIRPSAKGNDGVAVGRVHVVEEIAHILRHLICLKGSGNMSASDQVLVLLAKRQSNRRTPGYRYPALTAFAVATDQAPLT